MEFRGDVEQAVLVYKVSDFEQDRFDARKARLHAACDYLNGVYGAGTFAIEIKDTMKNMRQAVEPHFELVEYAMGRHAGRGRGTGAHALPGRYGRRPSVLPGASLSKSEHRQPQLPWQV